VTLNNLEKRYPSGFHAVRGVSIEVRDGEFLVLVGPSGCGKSTVLRMIAGLEDITSGTIVIGDRVVNEVASKDRDIAMVFQNYALYPHMTVRKNLSFALELRRAPRAEVERRVLEAAKMLAIEELLDRKPGQLSGGQRQRVAVGRAIVREPRVSLFDEPLSNLDAKLRVSTRGELKALHQRLKTTTIYVTHDQEEAMTLGDRIAVMSQGVVQQVGTPMEVYRRPANRFVAQFVGMPPMNFLNGSIAGPPGSAAFEGGGVRFDVGAVAPRAGAIALGLRPQSLRLVEKGRLSVTVEVVEPLGDLMDVTLRAGATRLVARTKMDDGVVPGQGRWLDFDPAECHWFEPGETGRRIEMA
jgi:multiple sugar transport system ATP-binding protein